MAEGEKRLMAFDVVKGKASGIPIDELSGSKATKELQATIERIECKNAFQARWMLGLTAIAALGAAIAAWPVVMSWFK